MQYFIRICIAEELHTCCGGVLRGALPHAFIRKCTAVFSGIIEDAIVIKQNELSYILCMTAHFKYKDHYARSLAKKSLISFTNASGSIP